MSDEKAKDPFYKIILEKSNRIILACAMVILTILTQQGFDRSNNQNSKMVTAIQDIPGDLKKINDNIQDIKNSISAELRPEIKRNSERIEEVGKQLDGVQQRVQYLERDKMEGKKR